MKQLLILSGKGGTGKTTIASAFIKLAEARAYADCDVDAPNLHLTAGWTQEPNRRDFFGLPRAEIDPDLCTGCGLCCQHCRFKAIARNGTYQVDPLACEGCGVCEFVCPAAAIAMVPHADGEIMLFDDSEKIFSTAQLNMGSGTSGLLVSEVKREMRQAAVYTDLAIIDGSPGIGCPVIASLSGVDLVLAVAEPSLSGFSDLKRIIETAEKFGTAAVVCINKYDINLENTRRIQEFCQTGGVPLVGKIPFDAQVVKAMNHGLTIIEADCEAKEAVRSIFAKTMDVLFSRIEGGNK